MRTLILTNESSLLRRALCSGLSLIFLVGQIILPGMGSAQLNVPLPSTMIAPSAAFAPALIKGLRLDPANPLHFDFIIDQGAAIAEGEVLRAEADRLIKYFLASLTVPQDELWVNLSPHESDRIIPKSFGATDMGRDLLAQDYILKQLTASLMYPEGESGKRFWKEIRKRAYEQFGTTDIPVSSFNKVWIVPEKALVYEQDNMAFVVEARLKVMLEEDYFAMQQVTKDERRGTRDEQVASIVHHPSSIGTSDVVSEIIRDIIIPEIEREVNEGAHFAPLRQIYHSMILAAWFKRHVENNIINTVYTDQNKIDGIDIDDKQAKQRIYEQYLKAFKAGVYDYIKEDYDPASKAFVPRKYFSGGFEGSAIDQAMTLVKDPEHAHALMDQLAASRLLSVAVGLRPEAADEATAAKINLPKEQWQAGDVVWVKGDRREAQILGINEMDWRGRKAKMISIDLSYASSSSIVSKDEMLVQIPFDDAQKYISFRRRESLRVEEEDASIKMGQDEAMAAPEGSEEYYYSAQEPQTIDASSDSGAAIIELRRALEQRLPQLTRSQLEYFDERIVADLKIIFDEDATYAGHAVALREYLAEQAGDFDLFDWIIYRLAERQLEEAPPVIVDARGFIDDIINERPQSSSDITYYGPSYYDDPLNKRLNRKWFSRTSKRIISVLETWMQEQDWRGKKVLEIAPGWDASLIEFFQERGAHVTVIDRDWRGVRLARQLHGVNAKRVDILELATLEESYDFVVAASVLYYVLSDGENGFNRATMAKLLESLDSVVKDGGHFAASFVRATLSDGSVVDHRLPMLMRFIFRRIGFRELPVNEGFNGELLFFKRMDHAREYMSIDAAMSAPHSAKVERITQQLKSRGFAQESAPIVADEIVKSLERMLGAFTVASQREQEAQRLIGMMMPVKEEDENFSSFSEAQKFIRQNIVILEPSLETFEWEFLLRSRVAYQLWHYYNNTTYLAGAFSSIRELEEGALAVDNKTEALVETLGLMNLVEIEKVLFDYHIGLVEEARGRGEELDVDWKVAYDFELGHLIYLAAKKDARRAYEILDHMIEGSTLVDAVRSLDAAMAAFEGEGFYEHKENRYFPQADEIITLGGRRVQVLERVASTHMGSVFKVRELDAPGMPLRALKTNLIHLDQEPAFVFQGRGRLSEEAELLASVVNEATRINIGHSVDFYPATAAPELGADALLLEWLEGPLLSELIKLPSQEMLTSLSLLQRLEMAIELADVLENVHQQGIVHRDIKPQNVKLVDGHLVLFDFGLAYREGDALATGGSPGYAAPEQWNKGDAWDRSVDIFALSRLLAEWFVGTPHLMTETDKLLAAHMPPEARRPLVTLLNQMRAHDPARRPSAAHVALTLRAVKEALSNDPAMAAEIVAAEALAAAGLGQGDRVLSIGPNGEGSSIIEELIRWEWLMVQRGVKVNVFQPGTYESRKWIESLRDEKWKQVPGRITFHRTRFNAQSAVAPESMNAVVMMSIISDNTASDAAKALLLEEALKALKSDGLLILGWYNNEAGFREREIERTQKVMEILAGKSYRFDPTPWQGESRTHQWRIYQVKKPFDQAMAGEYGESFEEEGQSRSEPDFDVPYRVIKGHEKVLKAISNLKKEHGALFFAPLRPAKLLNPNYVQMLIGQQSQLALRGQDVIVDISGNRSKDYQSILAGIDEFHRGQEAVFDKGERARDDDADQASTAPAYGGIDMNPELLDLETSGQAASLDFNQAQLEAMAVTGFTPVIISITPIVNVPLLLGIAENQEPYHRSDRLFAS